MQWCWKQCSIQRCIQIGTCWNFMLSMRALFYWQFVKVYGHSISGIFEPSYIFLRQKLKLERICVKRQGRKISLCLRYYCEIGLKQMIFVIEHLKKTAKEFLSSSVCNHKENITLLLYKILNSDLNIEIEYIQQWRPWLGLNHYCLLWYGITIFSAAYSIEYDHMFMDFCQNPCPEIETFPFCFWSAFTSATSSGVTLNNSHFVQTVTRHIPEPM